MRNPVEIENIEELRRQQGIDDVELRLEIRELEVGDRVNLTFLTGSGSFEILLVRITSIRGSAFRGKLVNRPTCAGLAKLHTGVLIDFTSEHIHSLPKEA